MGCRRWAEQRGLPRSSLTPCSHVIMMVGGTWWIRSTPFGQSGDTGYSTECIFLCSPFIATRYRKQLDKDQNLPCNMIVEFMNLTELRCNIMYVLPACDSLLRCHWISGATLCNWWCAKNNTTYRRDVPLVRADNENTSRQTCKSPTG